MMKTTIEVVGGSVSDSEHERAHDPVGASAVPSRGGAAGVGSTGAHLVPAARTPTGSEHSVADHADQAHAVTEHTDQPHERPEDWGWHGEMGKVGRGAGWVVVAMLLVMNLGNQTRHNENFWLVGVAAFLVLLLLLDRRRRKNSWRG